MGTKVIFFDVDGTLMDFDMKIPESVGVAIKKLKANGHKTFICSGRVRIVARDPRLMDMGFDGLISGCGTMVEYGEEELFYYHIPQDVAIRTVEVLRKCRFEIMLEGRDVCYVYLDEFDLESQPEGLRESLRGKITSLPDNYGKWEFSKLICKTNPKIADRDTAIRELSDFYTFQIHDDWMVEMVPKQFTKGTAIEVVRKHLGIAKEDTFCFGDSVNDLDMLHAVGTGIVMGNGETVAKEAADYVTGTIHEDGIYHALEHFGLIG